MISERTIDINFVGTPSRGVRMCRIDTHKPYEIFMANNWQVALIIYNGQAASLSLWLSNMIIIDDRLLLIS
jgi:hypothetical protein